MFDVRAWFAALRGSPQPPGTLRRALVALDGGRFEEALDVFEAALSEAPDARARAPIHNKRGVALIALGRRDEARGAFGDALDCDPAHAPALVNVGSLLLEDGSLAEAIGYYTAALRADDCYAPAYRHLGIAYKHAGKRAESVRALRLADRFEVRPSRRRA